MPIITEGFTSIIAPPTVAPAVVRFRDVATGKWIEGRSEPKIDPNYYRLHLDIKAYDPCGVPEHVGKECLCYKRLVGHRSGPANLLTNVFANLVRCSIFGTTTTVTDVGSAGRSVTKTLDGGTATVTMCAGTGGTAATVADVNMQTQTETQTSTTVNTVSGSGSSGTYTITGTITATSDRAYQENGLKVTTTTTAWVFLVAHDTFTTLNVSNTGTLAVTYTFTNS